MYKLRHCTVLSSNSCGKGFSERNLEQMRNFYLAYAKPQTLSAESGASALRKEHCPKLALSWSHYVFLIRLDDEGERRFYEIESAQNNWSLKEREIRNEWSRSVG